MPIYEYECRKCKAHTEIFQKISDEPLVKCPACSGRLEKLWSQTGFQFKGSGWYITDYAGRKPDAKETGSDATKEVAKETADGGADKETKPSPIGETASDKSSESKKRDKKTEKTASPTATKSKD